MVLGKMLGGTLIALVQGLVFLVLGLTLRLACSARWRLLAIVGLAVRLSLGAHGAGLRDRLADGFDAGLSRHHERVSDADVAAQRRVFSAADWQRDGWGHGRWRW